MDSINKAHRILLAVYPSSVAKGLSFWSVILFSKSGFSEELEELAQKEKNIILKKLI